MLSTFIWCAQFVKRCSQVYIWSSSCLGCCLWFILCSQFWTWVSSFVSGSSSQWFICFLNCQNGVLYVVHCCLNLWSGFLHVLKKISQFRIWFYQFLKIVMFSICEMVFLMFSMGVSSLYIVLKMFVMVFLFCVYGLLNLYTVLDTLYMVFSIL